MLTSGLQKVNANKIILSARSEYFRKLFFEDSSLTSVDMSHISFNVLYALIGTLLRSTHFN